MIILKRIPMEAPVKYEVLVGDGILTDAGEYLREVVEPCRALLITDDNVAPLYANTVSVSLSNSGYNVCEYIITSGERSKNIHTINAILEFSAGNYFSESDIFIALGGGVIADITGVAAALYRNGLRHVLIPTSLLAAIDSSVIGRSSINLLAARNLAGVRWHPCLVFCDCCTFKTLPKNVFADGIAEAIRLAMISDLRLFEQFEYGSIAYDHVNIVSCCVNIKRRIINQNKYECGVAQLLNFGDIFGNAIEKYSDYTVPHANALACGMIMLSRIAEHRGITREPCSSRLHKVFSRHNIGASSPYNINDLLPIILAEQKQTNAELPVVLPVRPGKCRLYSVSNDELWKVLQLEPESEHYISREE